MEEEYPELFNCPDFLQGKYCHALCNYKHQTEEEKKASNGLRLIQTIFYIVVILRFFFSLVEVEHFRKSLELKLSPKKSKRLGPVRSLN